ncbi:MAG: GNAT family N-acetyltransferase [Promethearchaeota archaeon]
MRIFECQRIQKKKVIKLQPIKKEYIPIYVKWFNDPEITQFLFIHRPITLEMEEEWYTNKPKRENEVIFAIILVNNVRERLIGNCGIEIDQKNRVGSIGIIIGEKDTWNKGYGTEALRLMIKYSFNTLNLFRIELEVYDFNTRAIICYKKVAFF